MLNNYIKNRGATKTIIHNNNHNIVNEINWDADYDGEIANISIDTNDNGNHKEFNFTLDNDDLANILNIQSVDVPIDKRLKMDFEDSYYKPEKSFIEIPALPIEYDIPVISDNKRSHHISSPATSEELIIPVTIDRKTIDNFTFTPKRRHKRAKTHITHKVYKKPKTSRKSKSSIRSRQGRRKSRRSTKKLSSMIDLL